MGINNFYRVILTMLFLGLMALSQTHAGFVKTDGLTPMQGGGLGLSLSGGKVNILDSLYVASRLKLYDITDATVLKTDANGVVVKGYQSDLDVDSAGKAGTLNGRSAVNIDTTGDGAVATSIATKLDKAAFDDSVKLYNKGASGDIQKSLGNGKDSSSVIHEASGKIGIGTTEASVYSSNSNAELVVKSSDATSVVVVTPNNAVGSITFADTVAGIGRYSGRIDYDHSINAMYFGTLSQQRAVLTNGGFLGINDLTPDATLDVAGSVIIDTNLNVSKTATIDSTSSRSIIQTNLTASRAVVSGTDKEFESSTTTATEIGYISGLSGNLQLQLNARALKFHSIAIGTLPYANTDSTYTESPITVNEYGDVLVTSGVVASGAKLSVVADVNTVGLYAKGGIGNFGAAIVGHCASTDDGQLLLKLYNTNRVALSVTGTRASFGCPVALGSHYIGDVGGDGVGLGFESNNVVIQSVPSTEDNSRYELNIRDPSAMGVGVGGGLVFSGSDGVIPNRIMAGIKAYKPNATSGNTASELRFQTRYPGQPLTDRMILDCAGNLKVVSYIPEQHNSLYKNIRTYSMVSWGKDLGSGIAFDGFYSPTNSLPFGGVSGVKETDVEGDRNGRLNLIVNNASVGPRIALSCFGSSLETEFYGNIKGRCLVGTGPSDSAVVINGTVKFNDAINARKVSAFGYDTVVVCSLKYYSGVPGVYLYANRANVLVTKAAKEVKISLMELTFSGTSPSDAMHLILQFPANVLPAPYDNNNLLYIPLILLQNGAVINGHMIQTSVGNTQFVLRKYDGTSLTGVNGGWSGVLPQTVWYTSNVSIY